MSLAEENSNQGINIPRKEKSTIRRSLENIAVCLVSSSLSIWAANSFWYSDYNQTRLQEVRIAQSQSQLEESSKYKRDANEDSEALKGIIEKPGDTPSVIFRPGVKGIAHGVYVSINSQGLRGPEIDPNADYYIVVLGDSHAFGAGVKQDRILGAQIKSELNENSSGKKYECYTIAIPGWGIRDIALRLKELHNQKDSFLNRFPPIAYVYLFCPNDIEGSAFPTSIDEINPGTKIGIIQSIVSHPRFSDLTRARMQPRLGGSILGKRTPYRIVYYGPKDPEAWKFFEKWFEVLDYETQGIDRVLIPEYFSVSEPHEDYAVQRLTETMAKERGWDVVDPFNELRDYLSNDGKGDIAKDYGKLCINMEKYDFHPNEKRCEIMARQAAKYIRGKMARQDSKYTRGKNYGFTHK